MRSKVTKSTGFTLIEILVAVSIIGILAAVAGPGLLSWLNQQSLQNAVFQLNGDMFQAKSLAIKNNANCDVNFNMGANQYTLAIGGRTVSLDAYRGGVLFVADPAGAEAFSGTITFTGRGLCNTGQVFITNAANLNIYRIQTSGSGGIVTHVWSNTSAQWIRY